MTDNTAEVDDFDVFDDSIDLDAEDNTEPEEVEAEAEEEEPEGDNTEAEEAEDSEPPAEEDKTKVGQYEALKAERLRRQETERREAEKDAEIARLKSQYEPEIDPTMPDPQTEPEKYAKWAEKQAEIKFHNKRIQQSKKAASSKYEDYDRMANTFLILTQIQPELHDQALNHPDPAEFAYQTAKGWFDKQRQEIREELKAEIKTSESPAAKTRKPKAPDLTGATAIGSNTTKIETIDDDDDLFEDSPYR